MKLNYKMKIIIQKLIFFFKNYCKYDYLWFVYIICCVIMYNFYLYYLIKDPLKNEQKMQILILNHEKTK